MIAVYAAKSPSAKRNAADKKQVIRQFRTLNSIQASAFEKLGAAASLRCRALTADDATLTTVRPVAPAVRLRTSADAFRSRRSGNG